MPSHRETQFSPYSPQSLFELVADVEKYPEFLPWCRAARILERNENELLAELVITFAHLSEKYTSRVSLTPPQQGEPGHIRAVMVHGPFHHLTNEWTFTPHETGAKIDFFLEFQFRNAILEKLMGGLFSKATHKMTEAFRQRAEAQLG